MDTYTLVLTILGTNAATAVVTGIVNARLTKARAEREEVKTDIAREQMNRRSLETSDLLTKRLHSEIRILSGDILDLRAKDHQQQKQILDCLRECSECKADREKLHAMIDILRSQVSLLTGSPPNEQQPK